MVPIDTVGWMAHPSAGMSKAWWFTCFCAVPCPFGVLLFTVQNGGNAQNS